MIEIDHVTKRFGGVLAVDDLSLTVEEGEVVVLLGSSGCGKTTTLRMINRLVEPTSGTICIAGRDVQTMPGHELASRRRLRDPAERAVPPSHGHRQRDDGAPTARLGQAAAQRPGQRAARDRRSRRVVGEEVSGAALGWPTAARRRRPCPRRRPAGVADGRAVRRRRPDRASPVAARVPTTAAGDGQDGGVRHPRRRRGDRPRIAHRRDADARAHRPAGDARRAARYPGDASSSASSSVSRDVVYDESGKPTGYRIETPFGERDGVRRCSPTCRSGAGRSSPATGT